jgi:hypothetical protein
VRKWIVAGSAAVLVIGSAILTFGSGGGDSGSKPLLITATAQPRDLRDEVTVQGTLGRVEESTINSVNQASQVSRVYLDDGTTLTNNQSIIALDGRDSVTATGAFPFFRKLDIGAEGSDVRQLEQILKDAGYSPGRVDQLFTQQTSFALAQWQAAHNYPGATPQTSQTVNVGLQQGSGYKLGAQTACGLTIGPPSTATKAAATHLTTVVPAVMRAGTTTSFKAAAIGPALADPILTIYSTATVTPEGATAQFVVNADTPPLVDTNFTVSLGGTAGPDDVIAPAGPFTLLAGKSSVTIPIVTRQDTLVEPDETLVVSLVDGALYDPGSPLSATTTIVSDDVPELSLTGTISVHEGQSATVTVTADQAPVHDTQVAFNVGGTATPDADYVSFSPAVMLLAGHTTATATIATKTDTIVENDERIVISLAPAAAYHVGPVNTATITILGTSGSAALPVLAITSSTARATEGQPAQFVVSLDRTLSTQLQVFLTFAGNAVAGSDYNVPGGLLIVPPGQTSLTVAVPVLNDGLVEPDELLAVTVAPDAAYVVGSSNTAFAVIESPDLPKIDLVGGPTNIGLGGRAVCTIVADQAPVKDTSVSYTVTGSAQQGKQVEPLTGTALLHAGETRIDVPVLTLNTNVFFLPTDIVAGTWPTRLGQVLVKAGDVVVAGTPLFSLTETAFTVTLDASAGDRTKLKVGQSVTVQLQGADATAPGVISELDDSLTTDRDTKKQTYKGKVQVQGSLGAADGAPVTIKVVLQERLGALTVPIAAVKQNGEGNDVVRVIDLEHGGTIREVRVKTGLSEGSYIEIQSGLRANQVVVVEVDQGSNG